MARVRVLALLLTALILCPSGAHLFEQAGKIGLAAAARRAPVSAALIVVRLAVFFIQVFPKNQATANWTVMPDDWAPAAVALPLSTFAGGRRSG